METKFNFINSQICTNKNQSERLLALGLKKETANMTLKRVCIGPNEDGIFVYDYVPNAHPPLLQNDIPAWSLGVLLKLMPPSIKGFYPFSLIYDIKNNTIGYVSANGVPMQSFKGINIFDNIIFAIEWLIKEGHFSKEYLK